MNIFVTSDVIFCKFSRSFEKKIVSLQVAAPQKVDTERWKTDGK